MHPQREPLLGSRRRCGGVLRLSLLACVCEEQTVANVTEENAVDEWVTHEVAAHYVGHLLLGLTGCDLLAEAAERVSGCAASGPREDGHRRDGRGRPSP